MKTLKTLVFLAFLVFTFNCSSDDDSSSSNATTLELLTADTWYQESRSPGSFDACEKNSSFKFNTDNTFVAESFDDDSGSCESEGTETSTYTLNGSVITIVFGPNTIMATINSISETMLSVTDDEGDTIVFDKTQG